MKRGPLLEVSVLSTLSVTLSLSLARFCLVAYGLSELPRGRSAIMADDGNSDVTRLGKGCQLYAQSLVFRFPQPRFRPAKLTNQKLAQMVRPSLNRALGVCSFCRCLPG